jgi:hypothetical protein
MRQSHLLAYRSFHNFGWKTVPCTLLHLEHITLTNIFKLKTVREGKVQVN